VRLAGAADCALAPRVPSSIRPEARAGKREMLIIKPEWIIGWGGMIMGYRFNITPHP
jgi:hypothetical protein